VTSTPVPRSELSLPLVVTSLMKGVVYADTHAKVWRHLLQLQPAVRDYVATMGLTVVVDEAEGYAFLRQRWDDEAEPQAAVEIPRLVPRRALSFHVSLLLALLRKRLAEFDASDGGTSCVLTRQQIVDLVEVFLPQRGNEARMIDQIDAHLAKIVDLAGFDAGLRRYAVQLGALPEDAAVLPEDAAGLPEVAAAGPVGGGPVPEVAAEGGQDEGVGR